MKKKIKMKKCMKKCDFLAKNTSNGLKVYDSDKMYVWELRGSKDEFFFISRYENGNKIDRVSTDIIPILRPFSDLLNEIYYNNEKFIPIIELARIATNSDYNDWEIVNFKAKHKKTEYNFDVSSSFDMILKKTSEFKDFDFCSSQLILHKKLNDWKFDIYNLIHINDAISVSTLVKKPYN